MTIDDVEEDEQDERSAKILAFIGRGEASGLYARDLDDALYTMGETGAWVDDVTVSAEQALMCWRLVEKLRTYRLPKNLKM